jgi:rfaE bifunctional protein nucleotidyltransferase chain/domain
VTLDRDGTVLLDETGVLHRTWARPATEKQASGAGDTFVAALTLARACGLPLTTSADLAQSAADVVVTRPGTSVCSTDDLTDHLAGFADSALSADDLVRRLEADRAAGRTIVFTNGCFDVLHRGHTTSLNQAKRCGDVLVVAINDDESVRRLKGEGRPINPVQDRAGVLAALSCVDHVTVFSEDTPVALIERVRPDVYAKGGDHSDDDMVESEVVRALGGEVRILDYVPHQSTSAVVRRIQRAPLVTDVAGTA